MNKNSLAFGACILMVIMSIACNKKEEAGCDTGLSSTTDTTSIVGAWELMAASSGWGTTNYYSPCNGNRFIFSDSNTYQRYTNWQLTSQGTYRVVLDSSYLFHDLRNKLVLDNGSGPRQLLKVTGRYLSISIDANDGPGAGYERRNWSTH